MRLWLRLDEELLGATDDAGCYHRPEAVGTVLSWYAESVRIWMERIGGLPPETPEPELFRIARRLLRAIGTGRAEVRAELEEERAQGRNDRAGVKR